LVKIIPGRVDIGSVGLKRIIIFPVFFLLCYFAFASEIGLASWYGGKFHGRLTASGEVFDTNSFTAAHKTLPFGTIVRVTNLGNGKSVVVRINDRGPFIKGRIIDLSRAAANAIGMIGTGVARVKLDILYVGDNKREGASVKAGGKSAGYYTIQVGAFRVKGNALRLKSLLTDAGLRVSFVRVKGKDGDGITRVFVVDVSRKDLDSTLRLLKKFKIDDPLVREEIVKK